MAGLLFSSMILPPGKNVVIDRNVTGGPTSEVTLPTQVPSMLGSAPFALSAMAQIGIAVIAIATA
jgi:hypothetical protein